MSDGLAKQWGLEPKARAKRGWNDKNPPHGKSCFLGSPKAQVLPQHQHGLILGDSS